MEKPWTIEPQPKRRRLLTAAAISASGVWLPATVRAQTRQIRAVAFDAFPVFDPRPVFALAESLFPGRGAELSNAWRIRQFEYQWLRALGGRYADFWRATEQGLVFAARQLKLDLSSDKRDQLMAAYLNLKAWPDVTPALTALKQAGIRIAFLSNATPQILQAGLRHSGLAHLFDHVLSTDTRKTYKPDARAYQMGVETLGMAAENIAFVAFAGWDAAGAKWFGYPTYWANRLGAPMEELDAMPDVTAPDLSRLVSFVTGG